MCRQYNIEEKSICLVTAAPSPPLEFEIKYLTAVVIAAVIGQGNVLMKIPVLLVILLLAVLVVNMLFKRLDHRNRDPTTISYVAVHRRPSIRRRELRRRGGAGGGTIGAA